ncbi:MAG: glycosyltransferase family 4 protein [Oscillatoriales cyanobacterium SM2_1_8]|nr:glycosyltransferase family 4 protein [Oscillatoriales cyanobacterium SM2_1_8]
MAIACVGRFDPVKGMNVLIQAWRHMAQVPATLDIYGVGNPTYAAALRALAAHDSRIAFREPVPPEQVGRVLAKYDLLAVPSQCLETGPLVVYEAFAAGVPVVGSGLGGIAELVTPAQDGVLVPNYADPVAWAQVLTELSLDRDRLERLRAGVRSPRTMDDVAREMVALYGSLLA